MPHGRGIQVAGPRITLNCSGRTGATIIFSDTHLTQYFSTRKFNYLKKIITQADRVIIVGDFWDAFVSSFDDFIKSGWSVLFPLLRDKDAIYVFGNHDLKEWCNKRVALFSVCQADSLELETGGFKLHIEHGHRIAPDYDTKFPWLRSLYLAIRPLIGTANFLKFRLKLAFRRGQLTPSPKNEKMKSWCRKNLKGNQIGVFGHSHAPELDLTARFANAGFILFGYASYLKIENGEIALVEERY